MAKLYIICIDDQREVLNTVVKDLESFENFFVIEACESAIEAWELIEEIDDEGDQLALVVSDHVMPDKSGVQFLTELYEDGRFALTRKILLTGLATHKDTITAINKAKIDTYIEKPWKKEQLIGDVKKMLTFFVLEAGLNYEKYIDALDQQTLLGELRKKV
ncbi:MAG: response regulator [Cyclobacteriaceae bacterium]|nr:response regulator [Cyclobacteriaceae bacterium]